MSILVKFDGTAYRKKMQELQKLAQGGLAKAVTGSNSTFIRNAQVYLSAQMDKAMKANGGLTEGGSATVRGHQWRGWAMREVTKYGETVIESTRWYYRKFARGGTSKRDGATFTQRERGLFQDDLVRNRPFEKVWRKRASGARYSSSSKLMLDTGRMRMGLLVMKTTISGSIIELRPGAMVSYFYQQNARRPIWVLDLPADQPKLTQFAQQAVERAAKALGDS